MNLENITPLVKDGDVQMHNSFNEDYKHDDGERVILHSVSIS